MKIIIVLILFVPVFISHGHAVADNAIYATSNNWSAVFLDAATNANVAPQSVVGSAYVNDVYLRSISKWASQAGDVPSGVVCGGGRWMGSGWWQYWNSCQGHGVGDCPGGYTRRTLFESDASYFQTCVKN